MPPKRRKGPARHRPLSNHQTYASKYTTTDRQIAAYADAAWYLLGHGLTPGPDVPALRAMWKAGGNGRRMAQVIAERWELAS
jgi:hypothetical protein